MSSTEFVAPASFGMPSVPSATSLPTPIDRRVFREIMGRFPTGVAIVAARSTDGSPIGVTVNSFTSVSLDPPLILFCLSRTARSFSGFAAASVFSVNFLGRDRRALSQRFAMSPFDWQGVETETWETRAPILSEAAAAIDCRVAARHDGGDHEIIVGRVVAMAMLADTPPLVYYRGAYSEVTDGD